MGFSRLEEAPVSIFFGCDNDRVGHYTKIQHGTENESAYRKWICYQDGKYTPKSTIKEGAARIEYIEVPETKALHTVLAFHDYSVDSRGNSNVQLFCKGKYDFEQMLLIFRRDWSYIYDRFKYIIFLVEEGN